MQERERKISYHKPIILLSKSKQFNLVKMKTLSLFSNLHTCPHGLISSTEQGDKIVNIGKLMMGAIMQRY